LIWDIWIFLSLSLSSFCLTIVATFSTKKVTKFKKIKLTFILDSLRQNLVIKQISSRGFLLWHHQEAHQISQKCPLLRREQRAEKKGILRYLLWHGGGGVHEGNLFIRQIHEQLVPTTGLHIKMFWNLTLISLIYDKS
jgi:hypothetical protein